MIGDLILCRYSWADAVSDAAGTDAYARSYEGYKVREHPGSGSRATQILYQVHSKSITWVAPDKDDKQLGALNLTEPA